MKVHVVTVTYPLGIPVTAVAGVFATQRGALEFIAERKRKDKRTDYFLDVEEFEVQGEPREE